MAKNWGVSALKLFSLTTGILSLLLLWLFYFDYGQKAERSGHLLAYTSFESMSLLVAILLVTVFAYLYIICNQITARTKEFFIRKLYGANTIEIVGIVMAEAFLFLLVAFALSLSLIDQLTPLFNRITGRQVSISNNYNDIGAVTGAFLFIVPAFLIMLLPALRCAKLRAVEFLKKLSR